MKVCIVAEGCYPYVVGGVSGWINSLIKSFPNVEFILLAIVANRSFRGKFVYELPENLTQVYEVYLEDSEWEGGDRKRKRRKKVHISRKEYDELLNMVLNRKTDWGVIFDLLTNPVEILTDENDWVKGMVVRKMELGEPDEKGRRRPKEVPGSEFVLDVDTVIMALGTSPNPLIRSTTPGLDTNRKGGLIVDENEMTTRTGVFAGGDAVTGAATVILAMGAGKKGAAAIDAYLKK